MSDSTLYVVWDGEESYCEIGGFKDRVAQGADPLDWDMYEVTEFENGEPVLAEDNLLDPLDAFENLLAEFAVLDEEEETLED